MRPTRLLLALTVGGCVSAPAVTMPAQAPVPAATAPAAAAERPAAALPAGALLTAQRRSVPEHLHAVPVAADGHPEREYPHGGRTPHPNGAVLMVDGKVAAVGASVNAPADAIVIDGQGKYVTPGLIDTHSHLGVYPSPNTARAPGRERGDRPRDRPCLGRALGLAAGPAVPSRPRRWDHDHPGAPRLREPHRGRSVTLKVVPSRSAQGMKFPGAPYGLKMACGENPKRVYASRGPSTRMANAAGYRAAWIGADAYRRRWDAWLAKPEGDPPTRDLNNETLAEVLRGNILVHNHCYQADEMMQMIDIAKEFGYRIRSFHHGVEAYKIADILAREGISASIWSDWGGFKMEALDGVKTNVGLVHVAGARTIVHSDDASYSQRLNQEAAKSLAAARAIGLAISDEDAIRWITINAAWALGIERVTGSLEVGKNADLVLWSGHPFSVYTRAEKVWIDGAMLYDRADATQQWRTDFELGYVPNAGGIR
jgi:imidazolonepropionase-like amidohydrolase